MLRYRAFECIQSWQVLAWTARQHVIYRFIKLCRLSPYCAGAIFDYVVMVLLLLSLLLLLLMVLFVYFRTVTDLRESNNNNTPLHF